MIYSDIKCKVNKIIYYNRENKYGIARVTNSINDIEFKEKFLTIVFTNVLNIYEGAYIKFTGKGKIDKKYGAQIEVSSLEILSDDSSKEGIVNFLSKSNIKGIDIQNAVKIYNEFKENSLNVVLHETNKLETIKGIGKETLSKIKSSVEEYRKMEDFLKLTTSLNIPYRVSYKLFHEVGENILSIIKENPYKILELSENITFSLIDSIALKMNIDYLRSKERITSCAFYALNKCVQMTSSTGTGYDSIRLKNKFFKDLGTEDLNLYYVAINNLEEEGLIVIEDNIIYNKAFYDLEKEIAEKVNNFCKKEVIGGLKKSIIEEEINNFPFKLNEQQIFCIKKCLLKNISILTGSGGTGKSTVTKAIANIYARSNYNILLLSPTGKATRRLEECTQRTAMTVHKFLGKVQNSLNKDILIKKTVMIIDESSMIDILLFKKIIDLVTSYNIKLVLVGDTNQLPSVQSGNVFEDLIGSKKINMCRLTDITRQSKDSNIIRVSNSINLGILPDLCDYNDLVIKKFETNELLIKQLKEIYLDEINNKGINNVQVISPYKEGVLGINNLNEILDNVYNKNKTNENFNFKIGSKIVNLVNNYDKDVFNGETGVITEINDETLKATINNKKIDYDLNEKEYIQLANVMTVHRVQGSEYSTVFVILDDEKGNFLLNRKLLYTAVSRGINKVYIFTKNACLSKCVTNTYEEPRLTKLKYFLTGEELPLC